MVTWIIVGGLALIVLALLYVAHLDATVEMARKAMPRIEARDRVRRAYRNLALELGREPTIPELIDRLHPLVEEGVQPDQDRARHNDGLPPPYALKEMGWDLADLIDINTGLRLG